MSNENDITIQRLGIGEVPDLSGAVGFDIEEIVPFTTHQEGKESACFLMITGTTHNGSPLKLVFYTPAETLPILYSAVDRLMVWATNELAVKSFGMSGYDVMARIKAELPEDFDDLPMERAEALVGEIMSRLGQEHN